jgi:hypothetical protein
MDSIIFTTFTHPKKTKLVRNGQKPHQASKNKGIVKNVKTEYLKENAHESEKLQQLTKSEAIIFIAIRLGLLFSISMLISFLTVQIIK